jgi:hypothetical protein
MKLMFYPSRTFHGSAGIGTPRSLAISAARRAPARPAPARARLICQSGNFESEPIDHAHAKIEIGADINDIENIAVVPSGIA